MPGPANLPNQIKEFLSGPQLQERIAGLAAQLNAQYAGKNPLLIGVLNGGFVFAADLVRALHVPLEVDFVRLKSYAGAASTGRIKALLEPQIPVKGRHVLLVEDIVETGLTIEFLKQMLQPQGPSSLKVCCLLHKPNDANEALVDFSCFRIGPEFVVGYGLDYDEKFRNLPYVGIYQGEGG